MNTDTLLQEINSAVKNRQDYITAIKRIQTYVENNQEKFDALPVATLCGLSIDFDYLCHESTMLVVKTLGGKWNKTYGASKIDYTTTLDGIDFRIYQGEPPPNCKLVEKTRVVPAQPEREEKYFELSCTE